jgi:hypothetical protein
VIGNYFHLADFPATWNLDLGNQPGVFIIGGTRQGKEVYLNQWLNDIYRFKEQGVFIEWVTSMNSNLLSLRG